MSSKTKFVFQFDEDFCNEHKQVINDESMIKCYTCDKYFKRGEWIFSVPSFKGRQKRRHLVCALRVQVAPTKYSKYLNAFYAVSLAVWLAELGRHFLVSNV